MIDALRYALERGWVALEFELHGRKIWNWKKGTNLCQHLFMYWCAHCHGVPEEEAKAMHESYGGVDDFTEFALPGPDTVAMIWSRDDDGQASHIIDEGAYEWQPYLAA